MKYFITFLLGTMPFLSYASDYNAYIDGIYYILKGSNAIVTSGETKYEGEILIPDRIEYEGEEYEVKSISNNAFYQCSNLRVVSIPSTVSSIGHYAFSKCIAKYEKKRGPIQIEPNRPSEELF